MNPLLQMFIYVGATLFYLMASLCCIAGVHNWWEGRKQKKAPDDWEQCTGDWFCAVLCHCGAEGQREGCGDVCPKCGHTDKWKSGVYRRTCEISRSRMTKRSYVLEKWTEASCPVKEDLQ